MHYRLMLLLDRVFTRMTLLCLRLLPPQFRASAWEAASEEMVYDAVVPGGHLHFYAPTPTLRNRARFLLTKEPDTLEWIDAFSPSSVFWDVGANVGVFSLYAARRGGTTVLAFEPAAPNYHALSRNIHLNDLSAALTAYCLAFSGETELACLNLASTRMGFAMHQFGEPGEASPLTGKVSGFTHGMVGFSIDCFIKQFSPAFPNYIKLDVDGLEGAILEGAAATLRDPRLRELIIELSLTDDAATARAQRSLVEAGFRLISKGGVQHAPCGDSANHLYRK